MRNARLTGVALALAFFVAACGNGSPEATDTSQNRRATTTTELAEIAPGEGTQGGQDTAAGAPTGAGPTSTQSSGNGPPPEPAPAPPEPAPAPPEGGTPQAPPSGPAPAQPAASGVYQYDTDGTTQVSNGPPRPMPKVTTLALDPARGTQQRGVRDLRDEDGVGGVTEQILDFRAGGVHLIYLKLQTSVAGVTNSYEFRPPEPPLVVRTGATAGETSTFVLEGDGVTINTTATVRGTEDITAAKTTISALVLELRSTISGRIEGTQTAVSWIDTTRSLTIKEDVNTDVTQGAVRIRGDYTANIRRLSPS